MKDLNSKKSFNIFMSIMLMSIVTVSMLVSLFIFSAVENHDSLLSFQLPISFVLFWSIIFFASFIFFISVKLIEWYENNLILY